MPSLLKPILQIFLKIICYKKQYFKSHFRLLKNIKQIRLPSRFQNKLYNYKLVGQCVG